MLKYTNPTLTGKKILHGLFQTLPVKSFITWTPKLIPSRNKTLKYPNQPTNDPSLHMDIATALALDAPIGLVCDESHSIIAFDVDGVPMSHPRISAMLKALPTYCERTPSGAADRYRIIYSLPNPMDKHELRAKTTIRLDNVPIDFFNSSNNFITLTGQALPDEHNASAIRVVSIPDLTSHWPELQRAPVVMPSGAYDVTPSTTVDISLWLKHVPASRASIPVQTFMSKHNMSYHDFWLTGIMSIHATYGAISGLTHAINWSRNSEDFDEVELVARWRTFDSPNALRNQASQSITSATYQWYYDSFIISWPYKIGKSSKPVPDEYTNFLAFLNFTGLKVEIDAITRTVFLSGPASELQRYYRHYDAASPSPYNAKDRTTPSTYDTDRIAAIMILHTREFNFMPSHAQIEAFINTTAVAIDPADYVNRFRAAVDSVPYDPARDPDLISAIATMVVKRSHVHKNPTQEFHGKLIKKWLLSLGRTLWPELLRNPAHAQASAEGMLVLSGRRQGIGKSSFGQRLFPKEWANLYVAPPSPRFSSKLGQDRDYKLITAPRLIVDYDEVERVLQLNNEAEIKAELTATYDHYRAPYDRASKNHPRLYAAMASTNKENLTIPEEGARRFWWLNVEYVDTYLLDRLDRYKLWAQIKYELSLHSPGQAPWLLSPDERNYLMSYVGQHRAPTNDSLVLMDMFDFSAAGVDEIVERVRASCDTKAVSLQDISMSISEIAVALGLNLPYSGTNKPKAALRHSVIDTLRRYFPPELRFKKSIFHYGVVTRDRQARYLMPRYRDLANVAKVALGNEDDDIDYDLDENYET